MEKINVKELNDNVFETIGKEWMLVTPVIRRSLI